MNLCLIRSPTSKCNFLFILIIILDKNIKRVILIMETNMDKERIKKIKQTLTDAIVNPMETCMEISFYIISLAVGIWILGFALSFLIKVMRPMIMLT